MKTPSTRSYVGQEEVQSMPSKELLTALSSATQLWVMGAAVTRICVAMHQAARTLTRIGNGDSARTAHAG